MRMSLTWEEELEICKQHRGKLVKFTTDFYFSKEHLFGSCDPAETLFEFLIILHNPIIIWLTHANSAS